MPRFVTRTVAALLSERPGLQRIELDDGSRTYVLTALVGAVAPGQEVVVNITAVELGLGTGGWHVVHWNLGRHDWEGPGGGHVVKLRYTSLQADTGVADETVVAAPSDLGGMPIVVCGLHSQLAPVAAVVRDRRPSWRIAYVMTDAAALPLAISDLVADLRAAGLLDLTVTAGQAFGGDVESVNVASGLCLARAGGADVAIVAMGPGGVGTGTELGFGALEVAGILDAVAWLGGDPIACLRYSEADDRARHRGVSHHTVTALARATHACAVVPVPEGPLADAIEGELARTGIAARHRVVRSAVPDVGALLARSGVAVTTMGRGPCDDPAFFMVAAAAGAAAATARREAGTVNL